ncbi:hypothetical protein cypCar_00024676 [Cyprinus carpio]|nr:hypothetical protein cypCar_00024676 [Cyprinus carpio]
MEELDKDQTSLQQIAKIHDLEKLQALKSSLLLRNSWSRTSSNLRTSKPYSLWSKLEIVPLKMMKRRSLTTATFSGGMNLALSWAKEATAMCMQALAARVALSLAIPDASPWRLTLMANKGSSVPQIIKLLDWQDDPDHYIMILERPMPSMSLFSFVMLRRRLDKGKARHVMWQVIHASNICCERGVFHRDIKLENLLVNPDTLEVKLIDFRCGTLMKDSPYVAFSGMFYNLLAGYLAH